MVNALNCLAGVLASSGMVLRAMNILEAACGLLPEGVGHGPRGVVLSRLGLLQLYESQLHSWFSHGCLHNYFGR